MLKQRLIVPIILTFIYVLACIVAFFYLINNHETDKLLLTMIIGILTMPWSLFFALFKDFILSPVFVFSSIERTIILTLFAIVNAIIIFFIARKITSHK